MAVATHLDSFIGSSFHIIIWLIFIAIGYSQHHPNSYNSEHIYHRSSLISHPDSITIDTSTMGRSTENSKKAAAALKSIKSTAATSSAKTNRRSSKGDNNTTIHLNEINKPNQGTPIVLTSLGAASASISKLQEINTPSNKQQPIDNIAAAVDQGTAKGKDDSPDTPETAPNTPDEMNTSPAKEASPSGSIATNNSSSTTPPSVAPTPTTEDMNISPKKGAPAANKAHESTVPAPKEAVSSKGAEEAEEMNISPKKPEGNRSSLKANTPMAPVPPSFATQTAEAMAKVVEEHRADTSYADVMASEGNRTIAPGVG